MSTLIDLLYCGQSYWLDNLTRKKITSGELSKRVTEQGLRGITSNPSIFNKAISESSDYDNQIKELVKNGKNAQQIYAALTIKDVQDACDLLNSVYVQSYETDGFVSLEVSPTLARDTQGTIEEARALSKAVGRQNCLIKIPGTKEGLPTIEQMLYEGININITLIFSIERYNEVAQAHIRAIERRVTEGKPVNNIISVASIFISRIDTLTDQLIENYIHPHEENKELNRPELLLGKSGIATARLVYQNFKEIFNKDTWKRLESKGAHIQRPLWASTSNKDPLYNDLRYVNPLIGQNTITTLPDETIKALSDHGVLKKNTIEEGIEQARQLFIDLRTLGIDIDFVTKQLENEGIQKFATSYNKLISDLANKRLKILGDEISPQQISYGSLEKEINAASVSLDEKQVGRLLFAKDPYLWETDQEQAKGISQRLGWLTSPDYFLKIADKLNLFTLTVKEEGFKHAVLLGMGGSSLCSEVAREVFETGKGYLQLHVLDNTDPAAIIDLEKKIDLEKTLFIVASKSGNTEETLSFFHYFYDLVEKKKKNNPGNNFVAITDEGTPLTNIAEQYNFKETFINPSDMGGRYSVLSYFGLLPMVLMGIDITAILTSAIQMKNSCEAIPVTSNPGINLGVVLGVCQKNGRDKLTFVLSPSISSFGYWAEQLFAESTGKEGKGLIPVSGETVGDTNVYGNDRVFIYLQLASDTNENEESKVKALEDAGHPVIRIKISDKAALGGEYYRFEVAVAIAGMIMGINPFDQPNVEESKQNTRQLLEAWKKTGSFKKSQPLIKTDIVSIYGGKKTEMLASRSHDSVTDFIKNFTEHARTNDYIALLPYFLMTPNRTKALQKWRRKLRDELKVATTLLNGPRYLHSTGQLHKGGPDTGLYIILIGDEENELTIPGEKFGFKTLHMAQALGDFRSLDDKGRRVIRIHLGKNIDTGLDKLFPSVKDTRKQPI